MRKVLKRALELRGDLQAEIMAAVWKLGEVKIEDVRRQQPKRRRSAYTTVQTVMNRLVERGVLTRKRSGSAYVYKARYGEADHLSRAAEQLLDEASPSVRQAALVNLIGRLDPDELDEVGRHANRIARARRKT